MSPSCPTAQLQSETANGIGAHSHLVLGDDEGRGEKSPRETPEEERKLGFTGVPKGHVLLGG